MVYIPERAPNGKDVYTIIIIIMITSSTTTKIRKTDPSSFVVVIAILVSSFVTPCILLSVIIRCQSSELGQNGKGM